MCVVTDSLQVRALLVDATHYGLSNQSRGVLQMKQRPKIYYTESQKALMWER